MKKLFILFLCLVAVAGVVSAGTVHPPGELSPVMPGYGADYCAVTPDTVLVMAALTYGLPGQILIVSDIAVRELPRTMSDESMKSVDYPLRL
jgi:hypothetical protein